MKRNLIILALALCRAAGAGRRCRRRASSWRSSSARPAMARTSSPPVDPTYPKLAGQYADYLEKALRDYQTGARKNAIMAGIAKPLSRADIRNCRPTWPALPGPLSNEKR